MDKQLTDWAEDILGPVQIVSRYAHDHGYSQLWRLQAQSSQKFFWLKCHQYPGKWAGEVHALTQWTPALNLAAPQVYGYSTDPLAVLLSEVDGEMASTLALESEAEKRLWHAVGEYLARLHTLENDWFGAANPDGTPQGATHPDPVKFVQVSIESRLVQGIEQGLFSSAEQEFIQYGAHEWAAALEGEVPRAIHRDYSPRNWMSLRDGQLTGVIDFEHARWDVRAADLNRWWDTDFVTSPHLAAYFFDGYQGAMPDQKLWAQIQALRLLGAAGGVVWATKVGDAPFAQTNREALHRLMGERSGCSSLLNTARNPNHNPDHARYHKGY